MKHARKNRPALRLAFAGAIASALALAGTAARAGDCAALTAAMFVTAKTSFSSTTTGTDAEGKPLTVQIVQAADAKYVERDGKWYRLDISSQQTVDSLTEKLKTAKLDCSKLGTETLAGKPTTVYSQRQDEDGTLIESKFWVSAQNQLLKAEVTHEGRHSITNYDYDNAKIPANVVEMRPQK